MMRAKSVGVRGHEKEWFKSRFFNDFGFCKTFTSDVMILTADGTKCGRKDCAYVCRQHAKGGGVFKEIPDEHTCDIIVKAKHSDGCLYVCGSCPIQPVDLYDRETKKEIEAVHATGATYPDSYEPYKNVPVFAKKWRKSKDPMKALSSKASGVSKNSASPPIVVPGKTRPSSTTSKSTTTTTTPRIVKKSQPIAKQKQAEQEVKSIHPRSVASARSRAKSAKRSKVGGGKRETSGGQDAGAIEVSLERMFEDNTFRDHPDMMYADLSLLFDDEGEECVRPMPKRLRGGVLGVQYPLPYIPASGGIPAATPARGSEFASVNQDSFNFIPEGHKYRSPVALIADEDESRHSVESFTTNEQSCTPSPPREQQARKHLNSASSNSSLNTDLVEGGGIFAACISLTSTMDQMAHLPLSRNVSSSTAVATDKVLQLPFSRVTSVRAPQLDPFCPNEGPGSNSSDFGLFPGPPSMATSVLRLETDEDIIGESDVESLMSDVDAEVLRYCDGDTVPNSSMAAEV